MRKWVKGEYDGRLNLLLTSDPLLIFAERWIRNLVLALYQAKERGRNIIDYKVT